MRYLFASLLALFSVATLYADPPKLEIPLDQLKPVNGYIIMTPTGDAKAVTYVAQSGVYPVPSILFADKRIFVLPVQGLANGTYDFVAVGSLNDEHTSRGFSIQIVGSVIPPPKLPPTDPVIPPPGATVGYFMVIRPDGNTDPTLTKVLEMQGWKDLIKKGHLVKDFEITRARALGAIIPADVTLPCVVTLVHVPGGKDKQVSGKPVPIPTTNEAITKLPETIK